MFVAATVIALCASLPASRSCAEAIPKPSPVRSATYRVLIPVDEQQKPTGDKYLVSEKLHNELLRHAGARSSDTTAEQPQGWQLRAATYRGALCWQANPQRPNSKRLVPAELKAIFDFEVFAPVHGQRVHEHRVHEHRATRVRIPFSRQGANLLPGGVLLGGRPIQLEWEKEGTHLALNVPEPGKYRLELALRPAMQTDGILAGFDLAIPPLANSVLELALPPACTKIEVPTAVGSTTTETNPPRLIGRLGPVNRLSVRWQEGPGSHPSSLVPPPSPAVEQLLWMKIQPGSVIVDASFKFKIAEPRVRQLEVAVDPRLRLLPSQEPDSPVAEVQTIPAPFPWTGPKKIRFKLSEPMTDQVVIRATFLFQESSGVGNLRLPRLEAPGARLVKRWLAVSIDPALQYKEHGVDKLEAVAVPDFAAAWGAGDVQVEFAHNLPVTLEAPEPAWSISTHPKEPQTTIDQTLAVSFAQKHALVRFDAQLVTTAGYHFQYRLSAPPELDVQRVSVLEESAERVARWSRGPDGAITVFLTGPVAGEHELSLGARLPTPAKGKVGLPVIRLEEAEIRTYSVELFRQSPVLLTIGKISGLSEVETPAPDRNKANPRFLEEPGRLVKSFVGDGKQPIEASLTLAPNRPKIAAEQITSLRAVAANSDGQSYAALVELCVTVSNETVAGGLLDEVHLEVPPQFHGPYTVNPPATLEVLDIAHQPRQLTVRPHAAISDSYRFTVSSPLTVAPGEEINVPKIVVREAPQPKHLVVLPTKRDRQSIAWKTRDLKETALPDDLAERLTERLTESTNTAVDSVICYQVVGNDFQAVLVPSQQASDARRVHLADVNIAWSADGTCHGVATFDLEPGGRPQCPLYLPGTCNLVQVRIAGVPTIPLADAKSAKANPDVKVNSNGQRRFRLPLGPKTLPQRIEVIFTGRLPEPDSTGSRQFDAPTLGDLPVGQTLWTISGPLSYRPAAASDTGLVGPAGQELLRLKSIATLIESAPNVSAEQPDDAVRWYAAWAVRLDRSRNRLRRHLFDAGSTAATRSAETQLQSIQLRQSQIAKRLGLADTPDESSTQTPIVDCPAQLWQWTLDRPRPVIRLAFDGKAAQVALNYTRTETGGFSQRLAGALGLVLLSCLAIVGIRKGSLGALVARWPHMAGVAVGLAWWLWLTPSILGWVIVLVSLVSSFRSAWQPHRQFDSTIIPLD